MQMHYVPLYVNDILFVSPDLNRVLASTGFGALRTNPSENGIKGLGKVNFILGVQVHWRENSGMLISCSAHLEDILVRLAMAKPHRLRTKLSLQLGVAPAPIACPSLQLPGPPSFLLEHTP